MRAALWMRIRKYGYRHTHFDFSKLLPPSFQTKSPWFLLILLCCAAAVFSGVESIARGPWSNGFARQYRTRAMSQQRGLPGKPTVSLPKTVTSHTISSYVLTSGQNQSATNSLSTVVNVNGQNIAVPANGTYNRSDKNGTVSVTHSQQFNGNDSLVSLSVQSLEQNGGEE